MGNEPIFATHANHEGSGGAEEACQKPGFANKV